jgi:hypothetical protein
VLLSVGRVQARTDPCWAKTRPHGIPSSNQNSWCCLVKATHATAVTVQFIYKE